MHSNEQGQNKVHPRVPNYRPLTRRAKEPTIPCPGTLKGGERGRVYRGKREREKKKERKEPQINPPSRSLDPGLRHACWELESEGAKLKSTRRATSHLPLSPTAKEMRSEPCSLSPLSHFDGKHLPLRVRSLSFTFS